jgi:hypothetical protein
VPTIGELRVRKEVEVANRRIVGFWGTVVGLRRVGKVGLLGDGGGSGEGGGGGDGGGDGGSKVEVGGGSEEAVGGDAAEAVAEAAGGVADQSVHGGSAKSVDKCETTQEKPQDDDGEKVVDGNDATEGLSSVEDKNQDEHIGETEATDAAQAKATSDGAEEKAVDSDSLAKESTSARDVNRDEHSGDTEKAVNGNDTPGESSSAKSMEEDKPQNEPSSETDAKKNS